MRSLFGLADIVRELRRAFVIAALIFAAAAPAAAGTRNPELSDDSTIFGRWRSTAGSSSLAIGVDGTFELSAVAGGEAGTFERDANALILRAGNDALCPGTLAEGFYRFYVVEENTLLIKPIEDLCAGRSSLITGRWLRAQ